MLFLQLVQRLVLESRNVNLAQINVFESNHYPAIFNNCHSTNFPINKTIYYMDL